MKLAQTFWTHLQDFFNLIYFIVLNYKQTCVNSSFVYLYLRQNQARVFLMVLIYLAFRNVMGQPNSAIIRSREPQLEISRSVDY